MEEFTQLFGELEIEKQRQIINHFGGFVTDNRRESIDKVLKNCVYPTNSRIRVKKKKF